MMKAYKDALSLAGVVAGFAVVAANWRTMPARVAIRYNLAGRPDNYGSPWILFLLPAAAGAIWMLFAIVKRTPSLYNLPVTADHPRRDQVAEVASEFIGSLGVFITWSFALMTWSSVEAGRPAAIWHPPILLCTMLLILGTPVLFGFYLVRMRRVAGV